MDQPMFTHEARCLVIVAGGVLERCIEKCARKIADSRAAAEIVGEDIEKAATELLREELSDLPDLIEQAIDNYKQQARKAA